MASRSRVTAPSISPRMCGARRARKTRCGTDEPLLKDEVLENLRRKELQNRAAADYFPSQPHLNARMRAVLVDWLIEVHYRFKFHNETLFLAVNYIDRYLEKVVIARCHLQLVGVTALLLASKLEEVHPIEITDLVYISDKTYTVQQIIDCEQSMLNTLQFQLTCSTCHHFLGYMFQVLQTDLLVAQLAAYYSQHALLDVHICTTFAPSKLAAACLFLAQTAAESQLPPAAWVLRFEAASMYSSDDLVSCINTLRGSLATPSCKLIAARNKFGSKKFGCVANIALPDHWSAPHNA
ncbi:TPA: hypothetical protein N0F65_007043 [Lagenidium giganteum]|uniref:Cyclin N-terminal domain-containing protein n=1 Tax=Lagenidium giganteum TaxID=4803 RepID=A0AAV2YYN8_9STRA|nr:TPA: hypothetical protein N0F65_007043 [Lagenidium giganteum]